MVDDEGRTSTFAAYQLIPVIDTIEVLEADITTDFSVGQHTPKITFSGTMKLQGYAFNEDTILGYMNQVVHDQTLE